MAAEPSDPWAGQLALRQIAAWCQRFSPTVGMDETDPAGTLLLDISGLAAHFGGEAGLAGQLLAALATEHRLWGFAAVADTVGAAWAAAHFAAPAQATEQVEGRPRSNRAGRAPRPPLCPPLLVPADQTAAMLAPLPLAALRLAEDTVALLAELGVRQIGQVAALPRSALRWRFGPELLLRYDQALGRAGEVLVAAHPPAELQARWLLEYPTDRCDLLLLVLEKLLARLAAALAAERRGALRIEVLLMLQSLPPQPLLIGLFRPTAALRYWLELIALQLENRRFPALVTEVEVAVTATGRLEEIQGELFDERRAAVGRSLAALVDRLSSRLGRTAVLGGELLHEVQPEYACRFHPLAGVEMAAGQHAARRRTTASDRPPRVPGERPVLLWSPPLRLLRQTPSPARLSGTLPPPCEPGDSFVGAAPSRAGAWAQSAGSGGPQFSLAAFRVRTVQGPERLETGWWRGPSIRRDYYRVETEQGSWLWLFCELRSGDWFLHGLFE